MRNGTPGDEMKVPLVQIPDDSLQGGQRDMRDLQPSQPTTEDSEMLHPFEQDWEHEDGQTRSPLPSFPENSGAPRPQPQRPVLTSSTGRHDAYEHTPSRSRSHPPSVFHRLRQVFARGNDIESSKVNHQFTREGAPTAL